jgi:hypothetical protein
MKKAANTPLHWSEDRLQQEIFRWFNNKYPEHRGLLFHVPNGGSRNPIEAKKLKFMGVTPGVSDLISLIHCCAFLELKRPDGKGGQSPKQKKWQFTVEAQGFEYIILNDLEEAKEWIKYKIAKFELWQTNYQRSL